MQKKKIGAIAAATLALGGAGVAAAHTAAAATAGCRATYTITSQWPGGFGANVDVTNLGDPVNGWRLTWTFPGDQTVTQAWNATVTQSGAAATATNVAYNAAIGTGATTSFGFNGAWSGSNAVPASFALNGTTCTGTTTSPSASVSASASASVSPSVSVSPSGSTPPPGNRVCDIYAAGGTPCIGAHSTTRALYAAYNGPLYQVQRGSDRQYLDVGLLSAGGVANAAAQDSFCGSAACTITKIYDQTSNHNDLPISWGGFWKGPGPNGADVGADAKALPVTVNGHKAYGIKVTQGVGYRIDHAKNAPTGAQPEGIYMVTSSNYVNDQCCFDYGSGENSHTDTGNATMNAIEWGTACWFGTWGNPKNPCVGTGPWVEADLENGMYHTNTGSNKDPNNSGVHYPFVSAWEKNNGTTNFTLKYGNATTGGLTTTFSGPLPNGYSPMKNDSSLLLGTGGDNSHTGIGEFFEGAITAGYPTDATENAVQRDVTAAAYH
ncbi:arabinofuranosidase catalytic domain-containing protein [Dactylosporangium matsuzakiense]|uniref:arabinofuranosidase catalytic domain-containing protein n=2 Tax=Dactylosporangium matsuzakiense TaxID=53360 RepID=UPI0021C2CB48|nr:arabinofuranosidase catalytic domain-containing protein [Dactylosporangium matsuzakiense]UWZ41403.1 cellulose binding domain-containing protein [Dactylosporangium matsuzakiense]